MRDATLETVLIELTVDNGANVPIAVQNLEIGVVQLDPVTGQPNRDPITGEFDFETDTTGAAILVDTSFTVARVAQTVVELANPQTAALINRLVNLLLDDVRVALVASGTAEAGDGTSASITSTDVVSLSAAVRFGIDFSIPASGVSFETSTVQNGLEVDSAIGEGNSDELARLIETASVTLEVENGAPFAVEAVAAVVEDSLDGDVFAAPGRILLDTIAVAAAQVDAEGLVTQPTISTVTVSLTGQEARVFFGEKFTAGIEVILKPPTGNRGAVQGSDRVIVEATASVRLRVGGSQ